jgi:hypothetical protein
VNAEHVEQTFKTRDEAETWVDRQRERRRAGEEPERRVRIPFEEATEAWYSDRGHEKGWSRATWKDYRNDYQRPPRDLFRYVPDHTAKLLA